MRLMVAISTHEGHLAYLEHSITTALDVGDVVKVYDDGHDCCGLVNRIRDQHSWDRPLYVELPKSGYCTAARIAGIADAIAYECDWILHLDADDWLFRRPIMPPDADIAFSDMYLCSEDSTIRGTWDCRVFPTNKADAFDFLRKRQNSMYGRNPIPGKSIYSVPFLKEHGLVWYEWPNTTFGEDVRTNIEYLKHDPRIVYTPDEGHYVYRQHGGQDTKSLERREAFMRDCDDFIAQGGLE